MPLLRLAQQKWSITKKLGKYFISGGRMSKNSVTKIPSVEVASPPLRGTTGKEEKPKLSLLLLLADLLGNKGADVENSVADTMLNEIEITSKARQSKEQEWRVFNRMLDLDSKWVKPGEEKRWKRGTYSNGYATDHYETTTPDSWQYYGKDIYGKDVYYNWKERPPVDSHNAEALRRMNQTQEKTLAIQNIETIGLKQEFNNANANQNMVTKILAMFGSMMHIRG